MERTFRLHRYSNSLQYEYLSDQKGHCAKVHTLLNTCSSKCIVWSVNGLSRKHPGSEVSRFHSSFCRKLSSACQSISPQCNFLKLREVSPEESWHLSLIFRAACRSFLFFKLNSRQRCSFRNRQLILEHTLLLPCQSSRGLILRTSLSVHRSVLPKLLSTQVRPSQELILALEINTSNKNLIFPYAHKSVRDEDAQLTKLSQKYN